jgi:hypothetical protein
MHKKQTYRIKKRKRNYKDQKRQIDPAVAYYVYVLPSLMHTILIPTATDNRKTTILLKNNTYKMQIIYKKMST